MDAYRSAWLDDELDLFRDAVRRFVQMEIVPHDARWREQHHVDRELWSKAGEVGLLCTDIPAEYGGVGGDVRHEAVVAEEMGRHGITSLGNVVHSIVAHYVLNHGTEAQKRNWLPRMATGELVGAIAMTEPSAGSDLQAIRTRAVRNGRRVRHQRLENVHLERLCTRASSASWSRRIRHKARAASRS